MKLNIVNAHTVQIVFFLFLIQQNYLQIEANKRYENEKLLGKIKELHLYAI